MTTLTNELTRDQLAEILDAISEAVVVIDREFVVTTLNRAAERLTGCAREEVVGCACHRLFRTPACEDPAHCLGRRIYESNGNGHSCPESELPMRDQLGHVKLVRIRAARVTDGRGNTVGNVHAFRPVFDPPLPGSGGAEKRLTVLDASERRTIEEVLRRHQWNRTSACIELGLSRTTLWRKMRKLGITGRALRCEH
jgi:PAS domain S-box-containing protein